VSSTQVPLSGADAAVIGLVAFAAVSFGFGWRIIRHTGTMAHEGAHAVVGFLLWLAATLGAVAVGGSMLVMRH